MTELAAGVAALRTSSNAQAEGARRALARLTLALIATAPLQNNLLEGLDVGKTRRMMQRAAPGVWAGDVKEEERLGAVGIIRRTALRSLAHQTAEIRRGTSTGNNRGAALCQAGFLAGMAELDGQALEDVRALMDVLAGENQTELVTLERWKRAVDNGKKVRSSLGASIKPVASNQSEESTFTALRVTELLPGASGTAAQRQALVAGIKRRALSNRADRDVLVVNGRVAQERNAETVRQSLQRKVKDPALNPYLATVKIVFVPEDRFSPESVLTELTPESSRFTMDLVTANPAAILVDPLRPNVSYRVLLLELLGGELLHVDLMDVARQALQAARVV
ncbi:MAG TPA: hypothetical protein PKC50_10875, partial [Elusimicrobiota bacterium]|nr:hypothetical protein [Elusimicrobiota bacterium]